MTISLGFGVRTVEFAWRCSPVDRALLRDSRRLQRLSFSRCGEGDAVTQVGHAPASFLNEETMLYTETELSF